MTLKTSSSFTNDEFQQTKVLTAQIATEPLSLGRFSSKDSPEESIRTFLQLEDEKKSVISLGNYINKTDAMGEEIRQLKKLLAELKQENSQLVQYKDQVKNLRNIIGSLEKENAKLHKELEFAKSEIDEMDANRKIEMEKVKSSFDEMDELLIKEKKSHRMEEEKLLNIISQLEANLRLSEKGELNAKNTLDDLNQLKKSKKKIQDQLNEYKQHANVHNRVKLELKAKNDELANKVENLSAENTKLKALLEHEKTEVIFYLYPRIPH